MNTSSSNVKLYKMQTHCCSTLLTLCSYILVGDVSWRSPVSDCVLDRVVQISCNLAIHTSNKCMSIESISYLNINVKQQQHEAITFGKNTLISLVLRL